MFRAAERGAKVVQAAGRFDVLRQIAEVPATAWDALVGDDDPFVEHAFLAALEASGAVGPGTGWEPCHLLLRAEGVLIGAMPLYLKEHSYGEYIFDWGWAEAAHGAGIAYYPKLVSAVPFTPAGAGRLLVHPCAPWEVVARQLLAGAQQLAEQAEVSSVHLLFVSEKEGRLARELGYASRLSYQLYWDDAGYASFDDYLARLRSSARKQIRGERRRVAESGLRLATLAGEALTQDHWDALYRFYRDTCGRKWGQAYLDAAFFEQARATLAHRVVATFAYDGAQPVAGALFFAKGRALYGRYWGATRAVDGLHFELCYYRPIEYCIARGIEHFEAGAQGSHKLKRGLLPAATHSAHYFRHRGLARAVEQSVSRERRSVAREMQILIEHGPFRRG